MDNRRTMILIANILWIINFITYFSDACVFHTNDGLGSEAEGVRFIRVREDLAPGKEILLLRAYPRSSISIRGMERSNDHKFFRIKEINTTTVQVVLEKSLDDLVDRDLPQNLLKFRIFCTGHNGKNEEAASMSVTVYVEDVNDHAPVFLNEPYLVEVDESTPPGTIIFQGLQTFDRDKPNTPNSDVQITMGEVSRVDGGPYFALESPHRALLVLKRSLDFDNGIREFVIPIIATDRGTPPNYSNTSVKIVVKDHDDLPPKFTEGVYRTKINEFYPMTGKPIRIPLYFAPPIMAFDQDSLNATLLYDIISGNERKLFRVNPNNGIIYLEKEIDLEEESLPGNTFVLQIEARQKDSPIKRALARIEVEVIDLNDNPPEFEVEYYNISIVENLPSGFSVLQVNAIDKDQGENAEFFYNLAEEKPPGAFLIDTRTGWITVRDHTLLDREVRASIAMRVQAVERVHPYDVDRPKDSGTVQVEITLLDSNDNTPQFENGNLYEFKVNVNAGVNTVIGKVTAIDPDEGRNGMILYDLQRPKGSGYIPFRLDSQTGTLFVSGPLRRGRIALFVEASDQPTNPSERRFSLAVVTIEVHAAVNEEAIEFVGAPYEFWVGADVQVGTSVGQVRTNLDYDGDGDIMYDLLHSYPEGVPFAIEERSGIVTVIRELIDFERLIYYFEAVANYQVSNHPRGRLTRRDYRSEKQITKSGDVLEIDEGVVAGSENVLVTNVTIHIVGPNDDRGILMKGTNVNPIEFHIKENLPGALIGRLLYKTGGKPNEKSMNEFKDIVGHENTDTTRNNRNLNSKFRRNATTHSMSFSSLVETKRRKIREVKEQLEQSTTVAFVTPMVLFDDQFDEIQQALESRSFDTAATSPIKRSPIVIPNPSPSSSPSPNLRLKDGGEKSSTIREFSPLSKALFPQKRVFKSNSTRLLQDGVIEKRSKNDNPIGLRFLIANQQDVANKITITDDGTLITLSGLDRETRDIYRLTIIAEYSKGFISGAGIYQVNIFVDDVNDNPPVFDAPLYSGMIRENSPLQTEVILNRPIKITDADLGKNSEFNVSLSGDGHELFTVELVNGSLESNYSQSQETFSPDRNYGDLQLLLMNPNLTFSSGPHFKVKFVGKSRLDREREHFYGLQLIATDSGGLSSIARLSIVIADVNDNPPIFEKIAVFKDSGVKIVEYSHDMEIYFVEKMDDGQNSIEKPVDYSLPGTPRFSQNITRIGRKRRGDIIRYRSRASRKLKSPPLFSVLEDIAIGKSVLKVTAVDEDSEKNAQVFYEISHEEVVPTPKTKLQMRYFSIDRISGELKINHPLQANLEITLNLTAKDIGGLSDSTRISFKVIDVNNHAPVFKKTWYSFDLQEGEYFEQSIDRIEASDADFGQNANITYKIQSPDIIPFKISPKSGVLKINGDLDREFKSQYEFHVIATDNAQTNQLSSSVEVEINVLDVNDNAPQFIGYDDILTQGQTNELDDGEISRKLIADDSLIDSTDKLPVYKAYLNRNTIPGTFVKQIASIDKDYAGNGNGLVMFSLLHNKMPHLFEIDSRDGVITTISKFSRYNGYEHVNLTIVASDLGNPSKSSMAMLLVNLQGEDIIETDEMNIFSNKYYELEVMENNFFPMEIIKLNVSAMYRDESFKWSIIPEFEEIPQNAFTIDSKNGSLIVVRSLDREERDLYRLKIRAEKVSREGRNYATMMYPIGGDKVNGLYDNEVRVVVHVTDENDHAPVFRGSGRPIVTVIPKTANFGFPVTQMEATDEDIGKNAEIRYKLLNEPSRLFGIDEVTGKIRILGPVDGEQRVYGFDVKATDRHGDDDGKSSIANVFVYVLDENRQVRLVIAGRPVDVERDIDKLTKSLSEATGMEIRVRLLEPHIGGDEPATDAYIYAIDPKTNTIVEMESLQSSMSAVNMKSLDPWPSSHILELSEFGKYPPRTLANPTSSAVMSGTEMISIILAILIFAGASATSLCVICVRQKRRRQFPPSQTGLAYSIARVPSSTLGTGQTKTMTTTTGSPDSNRSLHDAMIRQSTHRPTSNFPSKGILSKYDMRPREYIDVPLPKSVMNSNLDILDHEAACRRYNHINGVQQQHDISMQSHHSSGHDSGVSFVNNRERSETPSENLLRIIRNRQSGGIHQKCACNRLEKNVCCIGVGDGNGGDSSDSYEDSLKNGEFPHSNQTHLQQSIPVTATTRGGLAAMQSNNEFRRSISNSKSRHGMRHSFSGVRDDLVQDSPRISIRPRGHSFRNSMTDLEQRLQNLEQSFREPFHLNLNNNSRH